MANEKNTDNKNLTTLQEITQMNILQIIIVNNVNDFYI